MFNVFKLHYIFFQIRNQRMEMYANSFSPTTNLFSRNFRYPWEDPGFHWRISASTDVITEQQTCATERPMIVNLDGQAFCDIAVSLSNISLHFVIYAIVWPTCDLWIQYVTLLSCHSWLFSTELRRLNYTKIHFAIWNLLEIFNKRISKTINFRLIGNYKV